MDNVNGQGKREQEKLIVAPEGQSSEILVVLHRGQTAPANLFEARQPVHTISDRVLAIEPPVSSTLGDLQGEPAVRWAGTDPPAEVLDALDAAERLFVDGWLLRRRTANLERPGEGLDWDTPGRLPPDRPE